MRARGFTLLEVLVAMSIFAVIGLSANRLLTTIIDTRDITSANNKALRATVRALSTLERDLTQIVPRFVRDEYGDALAPLTVLTGHYAIEMSRTGWNNPAKTKRSELQRVAYAVEEDELVRYFWLVMDRAEDSVPLRQRILSGVNDFRLNLLTVDGERVDSWPDDSQPDVLPIAIEIIINTDSLDEVRRVFILAAMAKPIQPEAESEQTGDSAGSTAAAR